MLRGRGYSITLGTVPEATLGLVGGTPTNPLLTGLPSGADLLNDDDMLLEGMEESNLIEDFEKDYNDKLHDFEEAIKNEHLTSNLLDEEMSPEPKIFDDDEDELDSTPVTSKQSF